MDPQRTSLCGSALAAAALALSLGAPPASAHHITDDDLSDIELLGKFFFFDNRLSTPRNTQGCASCHDPRVGGTLPLNNINETSVGAPGAQPNAQGGRKPQNNTYIQGFTGPYTLGFIPIGPFTFGGAFWDGRAEGCAADGCQVGSTGNFSVTITPEDLAFYPNGPDYEEFLGPVADQALNPTTRPGVEQNTRVQNVCNLVRTGPYSDVFEAAYGAPIDCSPQPIGPRGEAAYTTSFKALAVSVAAYQGSEDLVNFTSPRDDCINQGGFPCAFLGDAANLGHDLFYGTNKSGLNGGPGQPAAKNAGCTACHNSCLRPGAGCSNPDGPGDEEEQTYSDTAYHSIGLPPNPAIKGFDATNPDAGLPNHDNLNDPNGPPGVLQTGVFKTPTLRNATKNQLRITKAFMHHGWLKSIEEVVHFYNTRFDGTDNDRINPNPQDQDQKFVCEEIGLLNATAAQAIQNDCWPVSEFPENDGAIAGLVGNLNLTPEEEAALVAFLRSLDDAHTATPPDFSRNPNR